MNEDIKTISHGKRYTLEEKNEILERWRNSDMSGIKFCKEHGIAPSTLHKWLNQLKLTLQTNTVHLSPVRIVNKIVNKKGIIQKEDKEQTMIEISLPNQAIVCCQLTIKDLVIFIQELSYAASTLR